MSVVVFLLKKKFFVILFLVFCFCSLVHSVSSCTIFTVTDDESIFFCANEDNSEAFQWRIWFSPASDTHYGRVFLGFRIGNNLDVPMAGFNDQGLAVDANAVAYSPISIDRTRDNYQGVIFPKWLAECATVEEVQEMLPRYNLIDLEQNPNQFHVTDKNGHAMVVAVDANGELNAINMSEDYLVSTNFNLNNEDTLTWELNHSGRYNTTATGLESMLQYDNLSIEGCRDILEETALNPNLGYGFVFELKTGLIYLYSHDDFDRPAVLNLHDELAKGPHSYAIENLVTHQTGITGPYIQTSILLSILILLIVFGLSGTIYFQNVRPVLHSISSNTKELPPHNLSFVSRLKALTPKSRFLLTCLVSILLFIFLKTFIKLGPFHITYDWLSIVYFHFTFVPILVIGMNFRPSMTLILSSISITVDVVLFGLFNGYGGELWIQLILSLCPLIGSSVILSFLRKRNLFVALFLSSLWYLLGFHIPAYFYYCVLFYFDEMGLFVYSIAHLLIFVVMIPFILLFNKGLQSLTKLQELESLVLAS